MRRRTDGYAGRDMADWTLDQLRHLVELKPGEPLGFARWRADPREVFGFSASSLIGVQARARAELARRRP